MKHREMFKRCMLSDNALDGKIFLFSFSIFFAKMLCAAPVYELNAGI